jgi:hypothetical protein
MAQFIYAALARSVKQKSGSHREEDGERCANDTKKPHDGACALRKPRPSGKLAKQLPYRRPLMSAARCPESFVASREMATQSQIYSV